MKQRRDLAKVFLTVLNEQIEKASEIICLFDF